MLAGRAVMVALAVMPVALAGTVVPAVMAVALEALAVPAVMVEG
jgi:hypothetical protein